MRECDVLVLGGGSAGMCAAVAAARKGARVVLAERCGFLGGMGTASLIHTFCGLYLIREEPGAELANRGLAEEIAERTQAATGLGPVRMGRLDVLPQHPVEFVRLCDELVAAEKGIDLLLHSEVVAGGRDGDAWLVEIACRGRREPVRAAAVVDASGDAVFAAMLGAGTATTEAAKLQRPAYVIGVGGVDGDALGDADRLRIAQRVVAGVQEGRLDRGALGSSFRSSGRGAEVFLTIDLAAGEERYDPTDAHCLAAIELEGRRLGGAVIDWLREVEPAWSGAYVSCWPVRAGVRESRRWRGRHVLTAGEWLAGARFDDEVGLATWPMEFRRTNRGPKLRYPEGDRPCGIPLRCLEAEGLEGVFMAGRCISTDAEVQASVRVMGTCFVTGEAAGRAAAGLARQEESRRAGGRLPGGPR
jgi:hypothetical protein